MTASQKKEKVAVLGGGPSALVAAFRLTEEPGWEKKYDITVYQQGWRVGGKCATGRDLDAHMRVYEHGIHGFLGCYFNAMTVMKDVFDALGRSDDHPLKDYPTAFHGMSGVIRYEMDDGKLKKWPIAVPTNDMHREDLTVDQVNKLARIDTWMVNLVKLGLGFLLQAYAKTYRSPATMMYIAEHFASPDSGQVHPFVVDPAAGKFDTRLEEGKEEINALLGGAVEAVKAALKAGDFPAVAQVFRGLHTAFMGIVKAKGGDSESERDRIRRAGLVMDFLATILIGVVADKVMFKGFAVIDKYDHVEWLRKHGASEATIASPLTSSTPNITYQYVEGDSIRPAVMAAGAYLHWTMMTFTYMGEFIQLFEAGSGETLIAPLHEILEKRGVKFAFFHEVKDIVSTRVAVKGKEVKTVSEIVIDVQATVKGDDPYAYKPYKPVKVKGFKEPLQCWPDRPLYDQLVEGKALEASGADLESFWPSWAPVGQKRLEQGKDFDKVIIGISVGALPYLTKSLARHERKWANMLKNARTVATQAMQIWLNKTPWDLGWNGYTNTYDDYLLSANFMTQPNGQGDFTKYIKYEAWPKDHTPESLLLLCGTIPFYHEITGNEGPDFPKKWAEQVKHQSIQFLQATGGFMLPGATVAAQKGYGDPFSFDFDLLHPINPETPGKEKKGAERFDDQYWRVNINPSDNYVSTPPDSTKHRLAADDTGFWNLSIAGDWTENGLNVGSMEGSVRSGLLAAEAILGVPRSKSGVIGLDPTIPVPKPKRRASSKKAAAKKK
ncbi:MAG: NAD(P)-binding protein [Pseudomonadota bacterium]